MFHTLRGILKDRRLVTAVGDEGGFAPNIVAMKKRWISSFKPLRKPIQQDQTSLWRWIALRMNYAIPFTENSGERTTQQQIDYLKQLCERYPIDSVEDGLDENDWAGWKQLTKSMGTKIQIVGDDLFVTNTKFLARGIREGIANAI